MQIATAPDEPLDITGARENIPSALSDFFNVHPQRIRELETDIRKGRVIVMTLCVADIDDPSALSGIDLLINITESGKDPTHTMWTSNDWLYEYSQRITFKPIGKPTERLQSEENPSRFGRGDPHETGLVGNQEVRRGKVTRTTC
ncbi:hypothetical protein Pmar_PMAR022300 [Perkinsus marinus ATCC 50983]|uniref:Uncharacterized protein n=1 Tax=Perkinsus marinus (strain ATCC 50983 / TXsc) TaxID=423536 RepID=C5KDQ2_PERM5|nr:hypothetical protein Pmar_PMAR025258 [Perkinsus marinus ATCC 50983]XP_002785559.1 hypothetical protein Pmar_PMAR022300 [Perkinsus marinus ATCC 50983]EER01068.1 hypothetical protein Pmar_PMAR025258 [Perkinsus marinus ATCC 50983]EER17355.1 hypothetical protein Pmar_PMAR022300 [Perkinsus marinus ATCC 50983]|eukprot:XP_002768350.1 hypothetical protein Pmar_PMAR025258 [Perkinsus marinus ATCC 50983]